MMKKQTSANQTLSNVALKDHSHDPSLKMAIDHRGCPRGNPNELEALRGRFDQLPYRLALQGVEGSLKN